MRHKNTIKPLFGLLGILIPAVGAEFTDQVTSIALPDVLGGFAISHDPGSWTVSLPVTSEVIGRPWPHSAADPGGPARGSALSR